MVKQKNKDSIILSLIIYKSCCRREKRELRKLVGLREMTLDLREDLVEMGNI